MSRGLTDEPTPEPEPQDNELDTIIRELVKGQNKIHDRLVDLERIVDHMQANHVVEQEAADRKFWKRGL
jgi:hypothetical protein